MIKKWLTSVIAIALAGGGTACLADEMTIYTENTYSYTSQIVDANGVLTGGVVEVVQELQRRVGSTSAIQLVPWARGYMAVSRSEPNVALFAMARTPERESLFKWVGPIRQAEFAFFARKDSTLRIQSLEDAKKVAAIGTLRDDVREQYLKANGFANLNSVSDHSHNVSKLMLGRLDLFAASKSSIREMVAKAGYALSDVKPLFTFMKADLYLAFSMATRQDVVAQWAHALNDMKRDGTYDKIQAHFADLALEKSK